jgi:hypothetical protein
LQDSLVYLRTPHSLRIETSYFVPCLSINLGAGYIQGCTRGKKTSSRLTELTKYAAQHSLPHMVGQLHFHSTTKYLQEHIALFPSPLLLKSFLPFVPQHGRPPNILFRYSSPTPVSQRSLTPLLLTGTVHIAVIGGTGLQKLEGYVPIATVNPLTPWGYPSAPIHILKHNDVPIAFLSRHGIYHQLAPHEVPSRANIAALRSIGVRTVIAFSAVGSLQEEIRPRDFVVPDQIIDRTKGMLYPIL